MNMPALVNAVTAFKIRKIMIKKIIASSIVLIIVLTMVNPSFAIHDNAKLTSTESLYDKCVPDSCGLFWSKPQRYYVKKQIYSRPGKGTDTITKTEHAGIGKCC